MLLFRWKIKRNKNNKEINKNCAFLFVQFILAARLILYYSSTNSFPLYFSRISRSCSTCRTDLFTRKGRKFCIKHHNIHRDKCFVQCFRYLFVINFNFIDCSFLSRSLLCQTAFNLCSFTCRNVAAQYV